MRHFFVGFVVAGLILTGGGLPGWAAAQPTAAVTEPVTTGAVDPAGSISGRVVDASGQPVRTGQVRVHRTHTSDGSEVHGGYWDVPPSWLSTSDPDGDEFLIGGLHPGRYLLRYIPQAGNAFAPVWWPAASEDWDAVPIEIRVGEDLTDVTIEVPAAASITGHVALAADSTRARAEVFIERWSGLDDDFSLYATTVTEVETGDYVLENLPAGTYRVRAISSTSAEVWWEGALSASGATPIVVAPGDDLVGVDMVMPIAASIQGVLRGPDGHPQAGAEVELAIPDPDPRGLWFPRWKAVTDAEGRYEFRGLEAGQYSLNFRPPADSGAAREWWGDAIESRLAAAIDLGEYEQLVLDDTTLQPGAFIAGNVLGGVPFRSGYTASFWRVETVGGEEHRVLEGRFDTKKQGEAGWVDYTSPPLPAGTYLLYISPRDYPARLLGEWWPGALDPDGATRIVLAKGETRQGVDTQLAPGGTISGTVRWAEAGLANGSRVQLYTRHVRSDGSRGWLSGPSRDVRNGAYSFEGLQPGEYTLYFGPGPFTSEGPVPHWWGGGASISDALPIDLQLSQDFSADATIERSRVVAATPQIVGDAARGRTLEVAEGAWSPSVTFAYQWMADGVDLKGATAPTLHLTDAHLGKHISVRVRGSFAAYIPAAATSAPTAAVSGGHVATGGVEVRGTPRVGARVTAVTDSRWDSSARLSYQWTASGRPIPGATASTLVLGPDVVGKRLSVSVTASRENFVSVKVSSAAPDAVAAGRLTAPTPKISGTASVGSKLTASRGTWTSGTKITYRWKADGRSIAGATRSTFTIPPSLRGDKITVTVTGSKPGYTTAAVTSRSTTRVMLAAIPKISGTAAVGKKLTVKKGTWTTGTTVRYQWYSDGARISNATKSSWTVTKAHRGKKITVKVTGHKAGYTTVTKTSGATARVR